jgi:hypothetical protein
MKQKSVFEFGNEYVCTYFYDTSLNFNGIEIKLNNTILGSIIGLDIPEIDDEQGNIAFDNEVITWICDNDK